MERDRLLEDVKAWKMIKAKPENTLLEKALGVKAVIMSVVNLEKA